MEKIHQFNYKKVVKETKEANAKYLKKRIKLTIVGAVLLLIGTHIFEWITKGYDPALQGWYIERAVGMIWVVIMFFLYLYTVDKTNYKKSHALDIMRLRAKTVALDCKEKPSLEQLWALNERTYSKLDEQERALLAKAVVDNAYWYEWVFSESDLKLIAQADSFAEFERLMNESSNIISPKKKFVESVYKQAYLRTSHRNLK